MKEAEEQIKNMQANAAVEKLRQEQLLKEKLVKKKAKKAADLQKKHDAALQKKLLEQVEEVDLAMGPPEEEDDEQQEDVGAASKAAAEEFKKKLEADKARFEEEMRAAVEEQEAMKRELLARQMEERQRLEEEMKRDADAFEEKIKAEQERKMKELEEKKKKMEEEMSVRAENTTDEERKRLIDSHEMKMKQMEQDEKTRKASDDDLLRLKLAARKKKKQSQQQRKQKEELSNAEVSGHDLSEGMKTRMKATAFAELRQMALDGKDQEAKALLRQSHEHEDIEMRAGHTREFVSVMAALPDGADSAAAELALQEKQHAELAELHHQQQREAKALETGADMPTVNPEVVAKKLETEKEQKAAKLKNDASELRAKMREELQKMEQELEDQLLKEREEFDLKRQQLSTRAATRRQQMHEDAASSAIETPRDRVDSRGGIQQQTKEEILEQHETERTAHATALQEQENLQSVQLQKKIAERRKVKDAGLHSEMTLKFNKDALAMV